MLNLAEAFSAEVCISGVQNPAFPEGTSGYAEVVLLQSGVLPQMLFMLGGLSVLEGSSGFCFCKAG